MDRLLTVGLGIGLVVAGMLGLAYDGPLWLTSVDMALALVALAGVGMVRSPDLPGIVTWPLIGISLIVCWLFGLAAGAGWAAWLNLVLGCGFLALTATAMLPPLVAARRLHARPVHRHA